MKILFFSIGDLGMASSRARIYEFIPYLNKQGIEAKVIPLLRYEKGEGTRQIRWRRYIREVRQLVSVIVNAPLFDLVFIQRIVLPSFVFSILRKRCGKIIYDLDDAVHITLGERRKQLFQRMLSSYEGVIISNFFLEQEVRHFAKKSALIPTCINTRYFIPRHQPENGSPPSKIKIGWIGTSHTEKYLLPLQTVFEELARRYPVEFHIIATGTPILCGIPGVWKKWLRQNEVGDLQQIDIGIMPLSDGPWERMKSGYKILQYMAVGIPVVASGVGVNLQMVKQGVNGFIANTSQQWLHYLSQLIQSPDQRQSMGMQGRRFVEASYDHRIHFEAWHRFLMSV